MHRGSRKGAGRSNPDTQNNPDTPAEPDHQLLLHGVPGHVQQRVPPMPQTLRDTGAQGQGDVKTRGGGTAGRQGHSSVGTRGHTDSGCKGAWTGSGTQCADPFLKHRTQPPPRQGRGMEGAGGCRELGPPGGSGPGSLPARGWQQRARGGSAAPCAGVTAEGPGTRRCSCVWPGAHWPFRAMASLRQPSRWPSRLSTPRTR